MAVVGTAIHVVLTPPLKPGSETATGRPLAIPCTLTALALGVPAMPGAPVSSTNSTFTIGILGAIFYRWTSVATSPQLMQWYSLTSIILNQSSTTTPLLTKRQRHSPLWRQTLTFFCVTGLLLCALWHRGHRITLPIFHATLTLPDPLQSIHLICSLLHLASHSNVDLGSQRLPSLCHLVAPSQMRHGSPGRLSLVFILSLLLPALHIP